MRSTRLLFCALATLIGVASTPAPAAAQIAVALLEADNPGSSDDVRDKLVALGWFSTVDVIDVEIETPTLAQLQAYGSVLAWTNATFADATALGDVLADYVDGGSGVVLATFANACFALGGRYVAQDYGSLGVGLCLGSVESTLQPDAPGHPLLNGVSDFVGSLQKSGGALLAGADQIASYGDGTPAVATRAVGAGRTVDLNFWPISTDEQPGGWDASTDGARLMGNALLFAAGSPVHAVPAVSRVWAIALAGALGALAVFSSRRVPRRHVQRL